MDKIAHIHHVPVSHIALNWVTQKDFISASLVGVANQDQAQENSQAFAFSLIKYVGNTAGEIMYSEVW